MAFLEDTQQLKSGLIIFRRADVAHRDWYCRVRVPGTDKYKTISLKTPDINEARDRAFDHDADIRFRVKHDVPVFEKSFAEVAQEYSDLQKRLAEAGQITMRRWKTVDGHIRLHLVPYVGNAQILHVTADKLDSYLLWRKQNGASRNGQATNGSIRQEMVTFRAIMAYAARHGMIRERQVPKGNLPIDKERREGFGLIEDLRRRRASCTGPPAADAAATVSVIHMPRSGLWKEPMSIFSPSKMGTSVKMIEDYYGHITPAENAERILRGVPGWEPAAAASGETTVKRARGRAGNDAEARTDQ